MWICECGAIPEVIHELPTCEICRIPESHDWIDECELDDCIYAMEVSALCDDCQKKVGVAFGYTE